MVRKEKFCLLLGLLSLLAIWKVEIRYWKVKDWNWSGEWCIWMFYRSCWVWWWSICVILLFRCIPGFVCVSLCCWGFLYFFWLVKEVWHVICANIVMNERISSGISPKLFWLGGYSTEEIAGLYSKSPCFKNSVAASMSLYITLSCPLKGTMLRNSFRNSSR